MPLRIRPPRTHRQTARPTPGLRCLVVYDISNDRARDKVAECCLDYGLDRIQYSAFSGILRRTHQEELMLKIARSLEGKTGKVHLFVVCERDWEQRIEVVRENDERTE